MNHLIRGVTEAVERRCWYAAVALALSIPDVCATVDDAVAGVRRHAGVRYRDWCARYIEPRFSSPDGRVFLNGGELWSVRNAFLHGGDFATRGREPTNTDDVLAMFDSLNQICLFVSDLPVMPARQLTRGSGVCRTSDTVSVTEFCRAICSGAQEWYVRAHEDPTSRERMQRFLRITHIDDDGEQRPI